MRSQMVQFAWHVKSVLTSFRFWAPTLATIISTPIFRQAILVHHSIQIASWSDCSPSCSKADVRSLISLYILSRRGRSLFVNTPLVVWARAELLRESGRQPCWPLHAVVHTVAQDFESYSSMWLTFLVLRWPWRWSTFFAITIEQMASAMATSEDPWAILSCLRLLLINYHC